MSTDNKRALAPDHDPVVAFLASQPADAETDRLAEDVRSTWSAMGKLNDRAEAISRRLSLMAVEFVPGGASSKGLIAERSQLVSEQALLPDAAEAAARSYARALDIYERHVYALASHANNEVVGEINPKISDLRRHQASIESQRTDRVEPSSAAESASAQLREELAPLFRRRDLALECVRGLGAVLAAGFGDRGSERRHLEVVDVDRYARRHREFIARQVSSDHARPQSLRPRSLGTAA